MKNKAALNFLAFFGILVFGFLATGCVTKPDTINTSIEEKKHIEEKNLLEFNHILEGYRNGVLANQINKKLRTQIITFSFAEGNKVYFCTTSDKPMYEQLLKNPYVSYCTYPENFEPVLSLNGKVNFVEDKVLKERALESNYYAKRNFKSVDNPLLRVFCIEVEEIETYGTEGPNIYRAK